MNRVLTHLTTRNTPLTINQLKDEVEGKGIAIAQAVHTLHTDGKLKKVTITHANGRSADAYTPVENPVKDEFLEAF
jgi:predicted transcriptional regulator